MFKRITILVIIVKILNFTPLLVGAVADHDSIDLETELNNNGSPVKVGEDENQDNSQLNIDAKETPERMRETADITEEEKSEEKINSIPSVKIEDGKDLKLFQLKEIETEKESLGKSHVSTDVKLSDEEVIQLKENLNRLGFSVTMNYPSSYGPATTKAVRSFQGYYGLKATGYADEITLNKINEILLNSLKRNDNSEKVRHLKENLNTLGFFVKMNYPNNYGPGTEKAVKEFQNYYGLRETGVADPHTLSKIKELIESPLRPGVRNKAVLEMKLKLNEIGFHISDNPTNYYGTVTERVVREFQSYYGLDATGVADKKTLDRLDEIQSKSLKRGDNSETVLQLKENLNLLGFPVSLNSPKNFGPATERAVKEFQSYYNLRVTGVIDPNTLDKVDELIRAPMGPGLRRNDVLEMKLKLNEIGFYISDNPTNYYGTVTEKVVREFQSYYGLDTTGVADKKTLDRLDEIQSKSLKRGDNSDTVLQLKENLNLLGFPVSMNSPKNFGPATERAVKEFQSYYNLRVTGVVEEYTLTKVNKLLSKSLQRGDNSAEVQQLKENLNALGFSVGMNYPENFGPATERAVKEFQIYYGLYDNGIANDLTLSKINQVLADSLQEGEKSSDVKKLKENLNKLGFPVTMDFPNSYGPKTARAVRDFQSHFGLRVTGIAEEVTLTKIHEILNSPLRRGQNSIAVRRLKEDLNKIGFKVTMNSPNNYGPLTEQMVRKFQETFDLPVSGIADEVTLKKINSLLKELFQFGYSYYDFSLEHMILIQANRNPRTDQYAKQYAYVSSQYITKNGSTGVVNTKVLNVRFEPNTNSRIVDQLKLGEKVTIIGTHKDTVANIDRTWYVIESNHNFPEGRYWQYARSNDLKTVIDPSGIDLNLDNQDLYQFLVLSMDSGVSADYLDKELQGKGVLSKKGKVLKEAAEKYQINEFYLMSHAILETDHGKSDLSNGTIKVGKLGENKWVSIQPNGTYIAELVNNKWKIEKVKNFDESRASNIKKTYNMFGIGAVDGNANTLGSIRAYREGWFTAEKAIIGGTKFIAESYVHHPTHKQDTLYKMRWNPANPGVHQYATDIHWAFKQTNNIYRHYKNNEHLIKVFDIPVYK